MKIEPEFVLDVWPGEDEPRYAVRADQASEAEALRAIVAQYFTPADQLRYVGIRVVNLPEDEDHIGRRRRAHIFELA